jgi:hypothetical protein
LHEDNKLLYNLEDRPPANRTFNFFLLKSVTYDRVIYRIDSLPGDNLTRHWINDFSQDNHLLFSSIISTASDTVLKIVAFSVSTAYPPAIIHLPVIPVVYS